MKPTHHIWIDIIKEIIGFDSGFFKTLRDILFRPDQIIKSYQLGQGIYIPPSRFFFASCGYFILLSSYLIQWDEITRRHIIEMSQMSPNIPKETVQLIVSTQEKVMTTYFVPYMLVFLVGKLLITKLLLKNDTLSTQDIFNILCYNLGLMNLNFLILIILIALLPLKILIYVFNILILFYLFGFKKLFEPKKAGDFYPEHREELNKAFSRADLILYTLITVFIFLYLIYLFRPS